mgnify:FL=1
MKDGGGAGGLTITKKKFLLEKFKRKKILQSQTGKKKFKQKKRSHANIWLKKNSYSEDTANPHPHKNEIVSP